MGGVTISGSTTPETASAFVPRSAVGRDFRLAGRPTYDSNEPRRTMIILLTSIYQSDCLEAGLLPAKAPRRAGTPHNGVAGGRIRVRRARPRPCLIFDPNLAPPEWRRTAV